MRKRIFIVALLSIALNLCAVGTLRAGTTGTISGTVTDSATNAGIANVRVAAVAPTGRYVAATDAKGFYSFTGVAPDTYTLSFEIPSYQPNSVTGVNVFADQIAQVSITMARNLVTIGRVTARSQGSAFQPNQTTDTYTVTASQIATQLGKNDAASETALLLTLPGVSRDNFGYPVIRGGRENEEGFQYEGIPYTDALTNQFVNSLTLNGGVQSLQLTPGAGDASIGNNGTGTLNLISKRGAYPAFGQVDVEAFTFPYMHQFQSEYGFASPNGRISNYFSFLGSRQNIQFGSRGSDATSLGAYFATFMQAANAFTDNFVYKFGKNNNQSFQLFYENDLLVNYLNYGGIDNLCFYTCDAFALANVSALSGLSSSQIAAIERFDPYQTSVNQSLNRRSASYQPNDTFKLQYSNNLDSSTYLTMKYFKVNAVTIFDYPFTSQNFNNHVASQGGQTSGATFDATKQLSAAHLLKVGGSYLYAHPDFDSHYPGYGVLALSGFGSGAYEALDFLPANATNPTPGSPFQPTGYLQQFAALFPGGVVPRAPDFALQAMTNRQDWAVYLNDTFSPNDRLKLDVGLRVDGANYLLPSAAPCNQYAKGISLDAPGPIGPNGFPVGGGTNQCLYASNAFDAAGNPIVTIEPQAKNPKVLEPRIAFSYQIGRNDAIRASYGRSVEFALLADVDSNVSRAYYQTGPYAALAKIPPTAAICGISGANNCTSYGDQLYWENQIGVNGIPIEPVKPETFSNWDFSYSHSFGAGFGMKVTPYYRRGYDALALAATPKLDKAGNPVLDQNGNPVFNPSIATNLGINRTTGVEFLLAREAAYGLGGALSMTYINELSNVPPLSTSEDFFPTIPFASLQLGNVYRVGFLSPFQSTLAIQYKFRNGLKINPVVSYNKGYPIGNGSIAAFTVNGKPFNVPSTNITSPAGAGGAQLYVDPQNPGSFFKPNVDALRSGALSPSAGGVLSNARFTTNLDLEMNPPGSRSTFGVLIGNLFNNLYGVPTLNSRYQPIATGIAGPRTGTTTNVIGFPSDAFTNYSAARFGQQAYIISPNGSPTSYRLYYQLGF